VPGDCFRTALASLLGFDEPTLVPHFGALPQTEWWGAVRDWLQRCNLDLVYVELDQRAAVLDLWGPQDSLVLVGGPSPRGSFGHVVVGRWDGTTIWDPHPSRTGLADVAEFFVLTQPYNANWPFSEITPIARY
jgi:hypothetical protein